MTPISKNEVEEILHKLIDQVTAGDDEPLLADELTFAEQATKQITLLLERRETEARIDELGVFMTQLENNHHDMPIGTASQYATEQYMNRLDQLKASLNQGGGDKTFFTDYTNINQGGEDK